MAKRYLPEELDRHIREEAEKLHFQLLDIAVKGKETPALEIVLDKDGGITLGECSDFNVSIAEWIDQHQMFTGGYTLDVCSPGLDRELKTDVDFKWAEGKKVKVTTYEPLDEGKKEFIGVLLGSVTDSDINVEESEGLVFKIDRKKIAKAKLLVDF